MKIPHFWKIFFHVHLEILFWCKQYGSPKSHIFFAFYPPEYTTMVWFHELWNYELLMENVNRDKYYISPFSADLRMGQFNFYPSGSVMGFWIFPMEIFHGLGKNFLFRFQVCISYALGSSVLVPLDFQVPWPSSSENCYSLARSLVKFWVGFWRDQSLIPSIAVHLACYSTYV